MNGGIDLKTLICAINSKFIHSSLAVWCLAGALEKWASDVEYDIFEGTINENIDNTCEKLTLGNYELVAFSTYIWNVSYVKELARRVKEKTGAKILLGGPEVSYNAKEVLEECQYVDYIISGEGEEPFSMLAQGRDFNQIPGLCYRTGDKIIVKEPYVSMANPPSPYVEKYFNALNGRIAYIETSRGCPYRCAFCLSGRCGGVRFFDLDESKQKIILLANSGTKTVKFIDRTFNADRKRAIEIFEFIIDEYGKKVPKSVCFHFEIEGELIDDKTIEVLKKAPKGLFQFEIGLQTFNEKTLEHINRKTDLKKLTYNIKRIIELENIHVHIDLIAGMTYEDMESFEKSFNKALSLKPDMLQLGFLKLLHGADMREDGEKYKCEFSPTPPYEVISTEHMSKKELQKLHILEDVFEKLYNSSRFERTCEYVFSLYSSSFKILMELALFVEKSNIPNNLDLFSRAVYDFFSKKKEVNPSKLRDCMALDRLSTNRMGTLPDFLKVHSPIIKEYLTLLEKSKDTKRPQNVKRAATVLLSENKFIYVDYQNPDKIKNSYKIIEKIIKSD